MSSPTRWDALFDALLAETEVLTERIRRRFDVELEAYGLVPPEALARSVTVQLRRMLNAARSGRDAVDDDDVAILAEIGETRARQGIPIEDVMRAWRVAIQVTLERARELSGTLDIEPEHVLDFTQSLLAWSDVALLAVASAHRRTELELAREEQEHRADVVRGVLFGTLAPADIRGQLESYGVDSRREYVAIRARPAGLELERALGFHEAFQHRRGLSAIVDGDLAGFLRDPPGGAPAGAVGVGPPRPLDRLAESFRLASRALMTADAFALTGVFDLGSLGLRPAVAADADVGDALRQRYLEPLGPLRSSAELIASLRAYFECGQHVERAAEKLFVHPNTLRYRLGRFEELTGASLRDPVVAFEVWWALERGAMRT